MLVLSPQTASSLGTTARSRGAVIFVQALTLGGALIRIDATHDPASTLNEIDRLSPIEISLVGWIPHDNPRVLANAIMEQHKDARARGDWFTATIDLSRYILHVAQPPLAELLANLPAHSHPDGTVSIEEMAQIAGVSVSTLRRQIEKGQIPVLRFGRRMRFLPADVIASVRRGG